MGFFSVFRSLASSKRDRRVSYKNSSHRTGAQRWEIQTLCRGNPLEVSGVNKTLEVFMIWVPRNKTGKCPTSETCSLRDSKQSGCRIASLLHGLLCVHVLHTWHFFSLTGILWFLTLWGWSWKTKTIGHVCICMCLQASASKNRAQEWRVDILSPPHGCASMTWPWSAYFTFLRHPSHLTCLLPMGMVKFEPEFVSVTCLNAHHQPSHTLRILDSFWSKAGTSELSNKLTFLRNFSH